nr:immunoglobulin light chain junction region [Macaca mulatta]
DYYCMVWHNSAWVF